MDPILGGGQVTITAIETSYQGCRFRSRLEARWAVFFDRAGVAWQYEPQGFAIGGRPYLPDFLLPDSGTWVEVKGAESELDHDLMEAAPLYLPRLGFGPDLLILGPIPEAPVDGDWAWPGFTAEDVNGDGELWPLAGWWGFGPHGNVPSRAGETSCAPPSDDDDEWLVPALNMITDIQPTVLSAYRAARSARFEHGESGAPR